MVNKNKVHEDAKELAEEIQKIKNPDKRNFLYGVIAGVQITENVPTANSKE